MKPTLTSRVFNAKLINSCRFGESLERITWGDLPDLCPKESDCVSRLVATQSSTRWRKFVTIQYIFLLFWDVNEILEFWFVRLCKFLRLLVRQEDGILDLICYVNLHEEFPWNLIKIYWWKINKCTNFFQSMSTASSLGFWWFSTQG